jgi:hypothetical protein
MVQADCRPGETIDEITLEIMPGIVSIHPVDAAFVHTIRQCFALGEGTIKLQQENACEVFGMLTAVCSKCLPEWLGR